MNAAWDGGNKSRKRENSAKSKKVDMSTVDNGKTDNMKLSHKLSQSTK